MADTAYDQLLQAQTTAKSVLDAAQTAYTTAQTVLSNDSTYVYDKTRIQSIDAAANAHGGTALSTGSGRNMHDYGRYDVWLDGNMKMFQDGTTANSNSTARSYVSSKDNSVSGLSTALTNAQNAYNAAQKSVTDYETNSPVGTAIASATATAAKSQTVKNILYIVGTLVGIGILISLVRWYEKKNSKKTVTA